jgi:hypothetical protein
MYDGRIGAGNWYNAAAYELWRIFPDNFYDTHFYPDKAGF